MKDSYPIVELFKAAYLSLVPPGNRSGKQKEVVFESGVPQSTISSIMAGRREGTEEQRRAIAKALGFEYEDFLNIGRRELGLHVCSREMPSPPSPEVAEYLDLARTILESQEDATLREVIDSIATRIIYSEIISEVGPLKSSEPKISKEKLIEALSRCSAEHDQNSTVIKQGRPHSFRPPPEKKGKK